MEHNDRTPVARAAATAGADVANDLFRGDLAVERKANKTDLVTRADREAEEAVLDYIAGAFPDDEVVAEESDTADVVPSSGPAWIVDPIDGTNNYVRGIPLWATAVAAVIDGDPVAAAVELPALDETYVADDTGARLDGDSIYVSDRSDPETMAVAPTIWWPPDRRDEYATATSEVVRRFGDLVRFRSAQLTLAMIASGALDATFTNLTPNPWDSMAGAFLVEQAGGTVTDLDGDPWRHDSAGFVASNGQCHDEVLAAAQAVEAVAEDAASE